MKKLMILIAALTLSVGGFTQDGRMMGNNNGNYSFSGTEILLGAILILLIVGILVWVIDSRRNRR